MADAEHNIVPIRPPPQRAKVTRSVELALMLSIIQASPKLREKTFRVLCASLEKDRGDPYLLTAIDLVGRCTNGR